VYPRLARRSSFARVDSRAVLKNFVGPSPARSQASPVRTRDPISRQLLPARWWDKVRLPAGADGFCRARRPRPSRPADFGRPGGVALIRPRRRRVTLFRRREHASVPVNVRHSNGRVNFCGPASCSYFSPPLCRSPKQGAAPQCGDYATASGAAGRPRAASPSTAVERRGAQRPPALPDA
jgi:hypothetical protein